MTLPPFFHSNNYFFTISLPQQCNGTLHAPSSPVLQEQALVTWSSRPQDSHTKRSPSFISAQSAFFSPPFIKIFGLLNGITSKIKPPKRHNYSLEASHRQFEETFFHGFSPILWTSFQSSICSTDMQLHLDKTSGLMDNRQFKLPTKQLTSCQEQDRHILSGFYI